MTILSDTDMSLSHIDFKRTKEGVVRSEAHLFKGLRYLLPITAFGLLVSRMEGYKQTPRRESL